MTVTEPTAAGFVTVYPCTATVPTASNLNYVAGQTIANTAVTRLSPTGSICIYNNTPAHLIVDANGYDEPGSTYVPLVPARLLDTRSDGSTVDDAMVAIGKRAAGTITEVQVAGRAGTPTGATTAVVNVTVTEPTAAGFVTIYPCTGSLPTASNLNYAVGETIANAAVVKLSPTGSICIFNSAPAHLIVDTNGYDEPGSTYVPLVPVRLLDTRSYGSTIDNAMAGIGLRAGGTITEVQVTGRAWSPPLGSLAAVVNVTVTEATAAGFVTVYPCTATVPTASNLNYAGGQTIANVAVTKLSATGTICIYNNTATHLVVDVGGYHQGP